MCYYQSMSGPSSSGKVIKEKESHGRAICQLKKRKKGGPQPTTRKQFPPTSSFSTPAASSRCLAFRHRADADAVPHQWPVASAVRRCGAASPPRWPPTTASQPRPQPERSLPLAAGSRVHSGLQRREQFSRPRRFTTLRPPHPFAPTGASSVADFSFTMVTINSTADNFRPNISGDIYLSLFLTHCFLSKEQLLWTVYFDMQDNYSL